MFAKRCPALLVLQYTGVGHLILANRRMVLVKLVQASGNSEYRYSTSPTVFRKI
jgi:hypothetical protein